MDNGHRRLGATARPPAQIPFPRGLARGEDSRAAHATPLPRGAEWRERSNGLTRWIRTFTPVSSRLPSHPLTGSGDPGWP
eukprot:4611910-Alexandrium_andersonii.AAC.1